MIDIDLIIPCYGPSKIINKGLASIATQFGSEHIHVTMVNDCSPNTDCNYQDLVDRYKDELDIRCITMPENSGQGLTRQFGINNTNRDWFMFMDEDDQLGPLAFFNFSRIIEQYGYQVDPISMCMITDDNDNFIKDEGVTTKIGILSAPLLGFDKTGHVNNIPSNNKLWVNSKVYNREFFKKHNVRFNRAQSRHAEDYYWMTCVFYCLDNDPDYSFVPVGEQGIWYLWYPNEDSQSRKDPNYPFMLSGYTMDGSVNILDFMKNCKTIEHSKDLDDAWFARLLNSTVYSYYTFLSFINRVATTDYVPALELDWTLLQKSCNKMRLMVQESFDKYSYIQKIEELYHVKNETDVQYTEPWITFDDYIMNEMPAFSWSFEELLKVKTHYSFDEHGKLVHCEEIYHNG